MTPTWGRLEDLLAPRGGNNTGHGTVDRVAQASSTIDPQAYRPPGSTHFVPGNPGKPKGAGWSTSVASSGGATRAVVARIRDRCTMLSASICDGVERGRGIVWIHPDVVAEVSYSEMMQGRLRDPVLRRIPPRRGV